MRHVSDQVGSHPFDAIERQVGRDIVSRAKRAGPFTVAIAAIAALPLFGREFYAKGSDTNTSGYWLAAMVVLAIVVVVWLALQVQADEALNHGENNAQEDNPAESRYPAERPDLA